MVELQETRTYDSYILQISLKPRSLELNKLFLYNNYLILLEGQIK